MDFLSSPELASQLTALGQVLAIDLVLAGDNAVAVGLAAAALPVEQRRRRSSSDWPQPWCCGSSSPW